MTKDRPLGERTHFFEPEEDHISRQANAPPLESLNDCSDEKHSRHIPEDFLARTTTAAFAGKRTPIRSFLVACAAQCGISPTSDEVKEILAAVRKNRVSCAGDFTTVTYSEASLAMKIPLALYKKMMQELDVAPIIGESKLADEIDELDKDPNSTPRDLHNLILDRRAPSLRGRKMPKRPRLRFNDIYPVANSDATSALDPLVEGGVPDIPFKYRLKHDDIKEKNPRLFNELEQFIDFMTVKFFGQQEPRCRLVTALKYEENVRGCLGWIHYQKKFPVEELSLSTIFPRSNKKSVRNGFDFIQFVVNIRKASPRYESMSIRSLIQLAKFLFRDETESEKANGDRPYQDIPVVVELRKMANDCKTRASTAPLVTDEKLKWLSWPDYLKVSKYLQLECCLRDSNGKKRPETAVAWSIQNFILFSFLSCCPDRQRTIRELELGKTLIREDNGTYFVRHGPEDYKTGAVYGPRPPLRLSPKVCKFLDLWLDKEIGWRGKLNPQHNYVFTQKNGKKALTEQGVYKAFTGCTYRITGKQTNPHLVRDMIITHLRSQQASEAQMEALALFMGHSVHIQKSVYDRRTVEQKVAPAVELIQELNAGLLE